MNETRTNTIDMNKKNEMTPERLFEIASEKFYKVFDFDKDTKKSDKTWIRVGLIPNPNKEIQWNFFNGERLLCSEPFDKAEVFENGTAVVIRNNEYNVLRDDGTLVFDKWYHYVSKCDDGKHYRVEQKKDEYGLIRIEAFANLDGTIMSDWYDQITPMLYGNMFCVAKGQYIPGRKYAMYNLDNYRIESEWYDSMMMFQWKDILERPLARVIKNGMHNLITPDKGLVFDIWSRKPIEVEKDGSCQIYTEDGTAYNANANTGETTKI